MATDKPMQNPSPAAAAVPLVVCAGGLRVDTMISAQGEVVSGLPGGNALYAAAGAVNQGIAPGLWARYGRNYPLSWRRHLARMGVDTRGLTPVQGFQDHRTFYAYSAGGRRHDDQPQKHFQKIGQPLPAELAGYVDSTPMQDDPDYFEPLALRAGDWPPAYQGVVAVHLAPLPMSTHLSVPARLRSQGVRLITADPGERYMKPALTAHLKRLMPQLDAFLPSEQEIRSLFGPEMPLWEAAEMLCAWGAPLVIIKNGPDGILVLEGENGRRTHLPAPMAANDARIVDVTGAGDAFCGGFIVALAQREDARTAAAAGQDSAAKALQSRGAFDLPRVSSFGGNTYRPVTDI